MCEVCHKPIVNEEDLPPEIQDKVYRPREDEDFHADIEFQRPPPDGFEKPPPQMESIEVLGEDGE